MLNDSRRQIILTEKQLIPNISDDKLNEYCVDLYSLPMDQLPNDQLLMVYDYIYNVTNKEWREVETRKGDKVEVSNIGQVRDPKTKKVFHVVTGKRYDKPWYPFINLTSYDGINYPQSVHQLIAKAFCNNPFPDTNTEVNHIDGYKNHNWQGNLEWVTPSENIQHAWKTGLSKSLRGENAPSSKYTNEQIREVCQLLQDHPDWPFSKIADETGVNVKCISRIYNRTRWTSISAPYNFPKHTFQLKGEQIGNSLYTDDQIHQVCKMLQDHPEMSYREIGEKTGVGWKVIPPIFYGETWKHISKDYMPFPPRIGQSKYTEDQVRKACQLLQDYSEMTYSKISKESGMSPNAVRDVANGKIKKEISKDYDFSKRQV